MSIPLRDRMPVLVMIRRDVKTYCVVSQVSRGCTNQTMRTNRAKASRAQRRYFCSTPSGVAAYRYDVAPTVRTRTIDGTIIDRQCGRISNSMRSPSMSRRGGYPMPRSSHGAGDHGTRQRRSAEVTDVGGSHRHGPGGRLDDEPPVGVDVDRGS